MRRASFGPISGTVVKMRPWAISPRSLSSRGILPLRRICSIERAMDRPIPSSRTSPGWPSVSKISCTGRSRPRRLVAAFRYAATRKRLAPCFSSNCPTSSRRWAIASLLGMDRHICSFSAMLITAWDLPLLCLLTNPERRQGTEVSTHDRQSDSHWLAQLHLEQLSCQILRTTCHPGKLELE